jgi:hypothetical protein
VAVAALGAAVLLLSVIVLLAKQLAVLKDSRQRIEGTDKKIGLIVDASRPVIRDAGPVVDRVGNLVGPLSRSGRQVAGAVESLRRVEAAGAALADAAIPVLEQARSRDLVGAVATVAALSQSLSRDDRLVRLVDLGLETLPLAPHAVRTLDETLAIQRETRDLQVRSLAVQRRSLAIQRQTLARVKAIERRVAVLPASPLP